MPQLHCAAALSYVVTFQPSVIVPIASYHGLCDADPGQDMSSPGLKDSSYLDMSILQTAVSDVVQRADEAITSQPVQPLISVTDSKTTGVMQRNYCHAFVLFEHFSLICFVF